MKCSNCGTEFEGKFCTNCGTPAQTENTTVNPQPEVTQANAPVDYQAPVENVAPVDYQATAPVQNAAPVDCQPTADAQQVPNPQPYTYEQNSTAQNTAQNNSTSYGQQFTNQPNNGFSGQQFTNQPATAPNGKKPMSGGKIAILVISIVVGVFIIFGIIFGVVACNVINNSKSEIDRIISDAYDDYSNYEFYYNNSFGKDDNNTNIYDLSVSSDCSYSLTA